MGRQSRRRRTIRRAVVGLVVGSLLLTSGVEGGGAAAQSADGLTFADASTTEPRGDVARLSVRIGNSDRVALMVRAPDGGYDTRIRATDADGDGRVTVLLNTFQAGRTADESVAYAVGTGDRLTSVRRRTNRLDEPLPAGRYNLVAVAGSDSTSATLVVEPNRVGAATTATVPRDRLDGDAAGVPGTERFETGRVAVGDHAIVAINASGLGGVLASTPPPGRNLVYPTDSTPGATTTHTVRIEATRTVEPGTIAVEYDAGAPRRLDHLDAGRIRRLGIDSDGDGVVETDLRSAVTAVESAEQALRIDLSTDTTLAANETLLVQYRATNPAEAGSYEVHAAVGGTVEHDGTVVYGVAGRGTLGYGFDLGLTAAGNRTVVDPLAAVNYHYEDGRLYALVNTSALAAGERYGVGLIRWGVSPLAAETESAGASVQLTERRATVVAPTPENPPVAGGETTVRAETTLAPTTEVVITVRDTGANAFLFRQATRVGPDRRLAATFGLPVSAAERSVTVRIVDDGRVVGERRVTAEANH